MSLGNSAAQGADGPTTLEAEIETVRRRFGHLGQVEAKLGQGAMGGVYKIVIEGQARALKVILPKTLGDNDAVKRFHAEGKMMAAMNHPNILKVFDVGTCGDWPYMISELVDGGSVDDLAAKGPMAWEDALRIAEGMLEALGECHKAKIYHRDIKPSNVLLTRSGDIKLADFGIAKQVGSDAKKTTTGIILGTPAYIAPEVLKGQPADARSDLYAVGVLLYELMAGKLPWDSDDPAGFLSVRLSATEQPRLIDDMPSVPRTVDALVYTAMSDKPIDRYPTALTFLKALRVTRDRLVTTHGKAPMATARLSSTSIPKLELPQDAPTGVMPAPLTPASRPAGGMRSTNQRIKKPVIAARPPPEPASSLKPALIGLVIGVALFSIIGIVLSKRHPPVVQVPLSEAKFAEVSLELEEKQVFDRVSLLLNDAAMNTVATEHLKNIAGRPKESAARLFYALSRMSPRADLKLFLVRTGQPLAATAAVDILCEHSGDARLRQEAAQYLLATVDRTPSPTPPLPVSPQLISLLIGADNRDTPEIISAALQTIAWSGDATITDKAVVTAIRAAPDAVGWVGGGAGDPEAILLRALQRTNGKAAQDAVAEIMSRAKPRGTGLNIDKVSGKNH